jgi:hypothetical protein
MKYLNKNYYQTKEKILLREDYSNTAYLLFCIAVEGPSNVLIVMSPNPGIQLSIVGGKLQ